MIKRFVSLLAVCSCAFGWAASLGGASTSGDLEFADWTEATTTVASGTLRGASVTFSGDVVTPTSGGSTVDGSSTIFSASHFTPALAQSDAITFHSAPGYRYQFDFGAPATNPVLHIASLASEFEFPAGTSITRVSGEPQFTVSGNKVTGALSGSDYGGTVRLNGTFSSIGFTTTPVYTGPPDGVYIHVASAPTPGAPPPPPPPPGPDPAPPTTPTGGSGSAPEPEPVLRKAVVVEPVSGLVSTICPGGRVERLEQEELARLGCVIDATKGRVTVTSAKDARGGTQSAVFYDGAFRLAQASERGRIVTVATLAGPLPVCTARAAALVPRGKVKRRKLWSSAKGNYRTKGRYGAATVRGTVWYTEDNCNGTLVRVRSGVVAVLSNVLRRTVTVRTGRSYLAPARKPARRRS